jgi:hypothetical protein
VNLYKLKNVRTIFLSNPHNLSILTVPPRWKIEPSDINVERNHHVTLHCTAEGVPTPTVVWKKATGSRTSEFEEIREKPFTKLLSNGSLLLQHVKEDREGFYICQANNGIGTGIGKVIQLKVNCTFAMQLIFISFYNFYLTSQLRLISRLHLKV